MVAKRKVLIAMAAVCVLTASAAQAAGPLAPYAGAWRGAGTLDSNGRQEPLRCRSDNEVSQGGRAVSLSLVCASDSFRLDIHSDLTSDGHNVEGNWTETTQNVSGTVSGEIAARRIDASVAGSGFNANVAIQASGRTLYVSLASPQGRVQVTLRK